MPYVFSHPRNPNRKLQPWVLESQMGRLRGKIQIDPDAGIHTLRHTFLTEAGEDTDALTLQDIAGQDNDAICPSSGGVGQQGVWTDQPKKERSQIGVAGCTGYPQNPTQ